MIYCWTHGIGSLEFLVNRTTTNSANRLRCKYSLAVASIEFVACSSPIDCHRLSVPPPYSGYPRMFSRYSVPIYLTTLPRYRKEEAPISRSLPNKKEFGSNGGISQFSSFDIFPSVVYHYILYEINSFL